MGTGSCTKSPAWKHREVTEPRHSACHCPPTGTTVTGSRPGPAGAIQGLARSLLGLPIHYPYNSSDLPKHQSEQVSPTQTPPVGWFPHRRGHCLVAAAPAPSASSPPLVLTRSPSKQNLHLPRDSLCPKPLHTCSLCLHSPGLPGT